MTSNQHNGDHDKLRERLEAHSIPEPNSGCLLWTGAVSSTGYGSLRWKGRTEKAHRMAWVCRHGSINSALHACHKCDVRSCVNADHLFLGTNADNVADKLAKGRRNGPVGETHGSARFTKEVVRCIRAEAGTHKSLGEKYGVSAAAIGAIKRRETWGHV